MRLIVGYYIRHASFGKKSQKVYHTLYFIIIFFICCNYNIRDIILYH